jgi:hypothetical protein
MPDINSTDRYQNRIALLLDELALGIKWERPSLLISVYRSEQVKDTVQPILEKTLAGWGQAICHYRVSRLHYDIPLETMRSPEHQKTVFIVSGVRWGGGRGYSNAYRALNMHREYLVEANIRVIFWLTQLEARQLVRYAPDFWAFRHKVVEFLELPAQDGNAGSHSLDALSGYPVTITDAHHWLDQGRHYSRLGCLEEAVAYYQKARRLMPDDASLPLGIAQAYLEMGVPHLARQYLRQARRLNPGNPQELSDLQRLIEALEKPQPTSKGFPSE